MGVTTMKMISSTSITSTIGVTLMSELTLAPSFRFANAMEFVSPACTCSSPEFAGGEPGVPAQRSTTSATHVCEFNSCCGLGPAHAPALEEVIDQFARGVIHLHVERFHATG